MTNVAGKGNWCAVFDQQRSQSCFLHRTTSQAVDFFILIHHAGEDRLQHVVPHKTLVQKRKDHISKWRKVMQASELIHRNCSMQQPSKNRSKLLRTVKRNNLWRPLEGVPEGLYSVETWFIDLSSGLLDFQWQVANMGCKSAEPMCAVYTLYVLRGPDTMSLNSDMNKTKPDLNRLIHTRSAWRTTRKTQTANIQAAVDTLTLWVWIILTRNRHSIGLLIMAKVEWYWWRFTWPAIETSGLSTSRCFWSPFVL